ncbi:MAG: hypothetical protein AAFZ58_04860 [Pseudomonadota bacterium]
MIRRLQLLAIATSLISVVTPAAAHDACKKLDCQRLTAKIERTEAALRRPHSLAEGKKLKADLKEYRAEHWRFCR